ncbi:MAG: TIR domain-containing protein [Candidatus Acidiferrales bacterium]|jgi:tetratricopeptide (TPR) repeat protein
MRAFLSHSSANKTVVIAVHNALQKQSTWLDRAEIEWGDPFLEKITEGIASATDFVLFWSSEAAKSEWVRLEINMAFIQLLNRSAIRLRIVTLDNTPLPLYLQPFHVFSVATIRDPAKEIVEKLAPLLNAPVRSARSGFVNRHRDIERLEDAVDNQDVSAVWLFGFIGIGKSALVREALKRIFEGVDSVTIRVTAGTGWVELALALNAQARGEGLTESLSHEEIERQIRLAIETLAEDGRLLVVTNVQHWLNEDGQPEAPLTFLLNVIRELPSFVKRPVFLTSTRRPELEMSSHSWVDLQHINGLEDEHIAVLVRNWHFSIYGKELPPEDGKRIAAKLFGHPVAARMVAGLLGDHSADYLEKYPRELVSLRRDLARFLVQDLKLGAPAERLMETLALAGIALPASILAGGLSDEEFQQAVEQCARAGLITADLKIDSHPLFRDLFWHRLHRSDYQKQARQLAAALRRQLSTLKMGSPEYAELLPVTFRLLAIAGDFGAAAALRRDLSGELAEAAIILYNRRNYALADQYIGHVLEGDPKNWKMRLYRIRVRIRQEEWEQADRLIAELLKERPTDVSALHAKGWRYLRQNRLDEALEIFASIISRREHRASLRSAAECLYRMNRNPEALVFLARVKTQESENPFDLDLESRILEDMNKLEAAYESARLAAARDPLNGHMQHRLGQIRSKQGKPELAILHFQKAIELNSDLFIAANSLVSAYLDIGRAEAAQELTGDLIEKARTPTDRALVEHTKARIAFSNNDLVGSETILKKEISLSHNLVPNLGLLVQVEIALFDKNVRDFPTIADVALNTAEQSLAKIRTLDQSNKFADTLQETVAERRERLSGPGAH